MIATQATRPDCATGSRAWLSELSRPGAWRTWSCSRGWIPVSQRSGARRARQSDRWWRAYWAAATPDRSFVHALGLEVPADFEAIAAQRNRALTSASAHLIPDDLIEAFTWAGTSEDVARQVAAVVDMGFENIAFLPHPPWPDRRADGRGVRQGSQAAGRGLVARLMLGSAAPEFLQAAGCRQRMATWGGP